MQCPKCKSFNMVYVGKETYSCQECGHTVHGEVPTLVPHERKLSAYERTKAQVYATGNKWAIENFHATHD